MADWRDSIPSVSSDQPSWKDSIPDATGIQSQPAVTDQHGRLYDAANTILNNRLQNQPMPSTGSDIADRLNGFFTYAAQAPVDLAQGVAKGALGTAAGLGSIWNRFLPNHKTDFNQENLQGLTNAKGAQNVGKAAEQIGEFMLPTGEISGAGKLAKVGNLGIDAAKSGIIGGVQSGGDPTAIGLNAAMPFAGAALGSVIKPAAKALAEGLGFTSGATRNVLQRAFTQGPDSSLAKAASGASGYDAPAIAQKIVDATEDIRDAGSKSYRDSLDKLVTDAQNNNSNLVFSGKNVRGKTPVTQTAWDRQAQGFMGDMDASLNDSLRRFNVGNQGSLKLERIPDDPGLRDGIQSVHDMITDWGKKDPWQLSPQGLDALKKNLSPYIAQGGRLGAFTKSIQEDATNGLEKVMPGYKNMASGYAKVQDDLDDIRNALSAKANGESNDHAIVTKIGNLFKQPTDVRQTILKGMPNGEDLLNQIAGLHLRDILPKGIVAKMMGGIEALHPAAWPALVASSPKLVGQAAMRAGQASRAIQGFGNQGIGLAAKKTIAPGFKAFISNSNNSTNYDQ